MSNEDATTASLVNDLPPYDPQRIVDALERAINRPQMTWLELDKGAFQGKVLAWPVRSELTLPIQENLIVELYSR